MTWASSRTLQVYSFSINDPLTAGPKKARQDIGRVKIQENLHTFGLADGISDHDMYQTGGYGVTAAYDEKSTRKSHAANGSKLPTAQCHDPRECAKKSPATAEDEHAPAPDVLSQIPYGTVHSSAGMRGTYGSKPRTRASSLFTGWIL